MISVVARAYDLKVVSVLLSFKTSRKGKRIANRDAIKSSFPPDSRPLLLLLLPSPSIAVELQSEKGILKLTCENAVQFLPEQTGSERNTDTPFHSKFNGAHEKFLEEG